MTQKSTSLHCWGTMIYISWGCGEEFYIRHLEQTNASTLAANSSNRASREKQEVTLQQILRESFQQQQEQQHAYQGSSVADWLAVGLEIYHLEVVLNALFYHRLYLDLWMQHGSILVHGQLKAISIAEWKHVKK